MSFVWKEKKKSCSYISVPAQVSLSAVGAAGGGRTSQLATRPTENHSYSPATSPESEARTQTYTHIQTRERGPRASTTIYL